MSELQPKFGDKVAIYGFIKNNPKADGGYCDIVFENTGDVLRVSVRSIAEVLQAAPIALQKELDRVQEDAKTAHYHYNNVIAKNQKLEAEIAALKAAKAV